MKTIKTVMIMVVLGITMANADCKVITIFPEDGPMEQIIVCT